MTANFKRFQIDNSFLFNSENYRVSSVKSTSSSTHLNLTLFIQIIETNVLNFCLKIYWFIFIVSVLSVRVLDIKSLTVEKFPSDDLKSEWHASNDTIELPKGALLENSDGNLVRLVFVAFDHLEEILQWQPDLVDTVNADNASKVLNSKVISASLGKGRHIQLKEPVKLTLKHLKTENVSNPRCVFWDYTTNAWSEEGCHVDTVLSNITHTVCHCDHLTNFAILMDVHAIYLPVPHEIALQIITYVGCIISIICLLLAIITFQLFRGLKVSVFKMFVISYNNGTWTFRVTEPQYIATYASVSSQLRSSS